VRGKGEGRQGKVGEWKGGERKGEGNGGGKRKGREEEKRGKGILTN
jgi:hypothetical protein